MSAGVFTEPPPALAEAGRSRPRTLLITGIGARLARLLAERLEAEPLFGRILGVDLVAPERPSGGKLETAPFDPLAPGLDDFLRSERVEAIAHLLWLPDAVDPEAASWLDVGGAVRLFGAAVRARAGR